MNRSEPEALALGFPVMNNAICQSTCVMSMCRMNDDARILVDNKQVLIFIQNGKGNRFRQNIIRFLLLHPNFYDITRSYLDANVYTLSI
ncbi:hypothetical protein D3C76_1344200 [compost metagenome]